ncbi:myosin regulatory light chain sqh-like [Glossina fuscipes fuscipes]
MSSRKSSSRRRSANKKQAQRPSTNVFAMFSQAQIAEFKEAFNMIDQNRDGLVEKQDLHDMLALLGKNPTDHYLEQMMNEASGPINFATFLTMFGERLQVTDPEDVIKNAFSCLDEGNSGVVPADRLRELLTTMGDRFTDEDVDEIYREAPIKDGLLDYVEFIKILKRGGKEKGEQ